MVQKYMKSVGRCFTKALLLNAFFAMSLLQPLKTVLLENTTRFMVRESMWNAGIHTDSQLLPSVSVATSHAVGLRASQGQFMNFKMDSVAIWNAMTPQQMACFLSQT